MGGALTILPADEQMDVRRIFVRMLKAAVKNLERASYVLNLIASCLKHGVSPKRVKTILQRGFRRHINLLVEAGVWSCVRFVAMLGLRCGVSLRFLKDCTRTAIFVFHGPRMRVC